MKSLFLIVLFTLTVSPALACTPPPPPGPVPENVAALYVMERENQEMTEQESLRLEEYKTDQDLYVTAWLKLHPCPMYPGETAAYKLMSAEKKEALGADMEALKEKWGWE